MAVEAQLSGTLVGYDLGFYTETFMNTNDWRSRQDLFPVGDLLFTVIFALDVIVRIIVLRCAFWTVKMNYLDVVVTVISVVEVVVVYSSPTLLEDVNVNPVLFRLLRLGKLARAVRMVTMNSVLNSLQILTRCLASSATMLFWSFCLLTFFQCVFGMVASTLCRDFITDETQNLHYREEVFLYFGTFTRTFLTMFEILFANWAVPCRLLMENISEWFSTPG
ncbi:para [Symbiodinium sp. CCMP2592]|nr:para [Symbiodinium sp. CCMP2592]